MRGKGYISTEHTVWCGASMAGVPKSAPDCMFTDPADGLIKPRPGVSQRTCTSHYQFADPRPAEHARSEGWKKCKKFGWICPACAVKHGVK